MAEFDDKLNSLLSNPDAMSQIMQLAQSLSGETASAAPPPAQPAPPPAQPAPPPAQPASPSGTSPSGLLSALTGGGDPSLLMKLLPLIQELGSGQDSPARALLYALRPYLKPERQEKVERALQLARLFHAGRRLLAGREG